MGSSIKNGVIVAAKLLTQSASIPRNAYIMNVSKLSPGITERWLESFTVTIFSPSFMSTATKYLLFQNYCKNMANFHDTSKGELKHTLQVT